MYIFLLLQNFHPLVWYPLLLWWLPNGDFISSTVISYQLAFYNFPFSSNYLYHCRVIYSYTFFELLSLFDAQIIPSLASEGPLKLASASFSSCPVGALLPGTRRFRCVLYLNYTSPEICHFSKDGNLYFR